MTSPSALDATGGQPAHAHWRAPGIALLHAALDRSRAAWPDRPAVVSASGTETFRATAERVPAVAAALAAAGVRPGDVVALSGGRTHHGLSDLLGCWSAGATAVLVDPGYPAERLAFMIRDSGASHLLGPEPGGDPAVPALRPVRVPDTGAEPSTTGQTTADVPPDIAYLVYTSGSTGVPKGVEVGFGNLDCFLRAIATLEIEPGGDGINAVSPAFDGWLWCCLLYLMYGQTMHLLDVRGADAELQRRIHEISPSVVCLTPSLLRLCDDLGPARVVVSAGEACAPDLIARHATGRRFLNVYGPTETTIAATCADTDAGDDVATIGRPLPGYTASVRDTNGNTVAPGIAGELWIGGDGVARGYRSRADLTADRFVTDGDGRRHYRSGDLVRLRDDGLFEHLGRADDQVKVRGFRVELGEIEAAALGVPGVAGAAAFPTGHDTIGLAVVPGPPSAAGTPDAVRAHLASVLPAHLVPSVVDAVQRIPVTANGKLDRGALADEVTGGRRDLPPRAALTGRRKAVAGVWAELLPEPVTDVHADFFDAGGHSLLVARLITRLRETTGVRLPMRAFLDDPTIAGLADAIDRTTAEETL